MRHDTGRPNLGRRVALNEVGVMLRGRGSARRPWLGIALEGSYFAARHGWRAVLRVWGPGYLVTSLLLSLALTIPTNVASGCSDGRPDGQAK